MRLCEEILQVHGAARFSSRGPVPSQAASQQGCRCEVVRRSGRAQPSFHLGEVLVLIITDSSTITLDVFSFIPRFFKNS